MKMAKYAIGIAGRIGTGKTTLARALAVRTNGRVLSLAGAVKGAALGICGIGAFFPQVDGFASRNVLQSIGHGVRERYAEDVWVAIIAQLIELCQESVVIIPDIRYPNEVAFLKERFGEQNCLTIRLAGEPFISSCSSHLAHESENALNGFSDYDLVLNCRNDLCCNVEAVLHEVKNRGWKVSPRNIRVYISGNVMGNGKFSDEFEAIANWLSFAGCEPIAPVSSTDFLQWSEEFGLSPDKASWNRVVNDLKGVSESDAVLAWLKSSSIGSAIEIFAAALMQKPVVAIVQERMIAHPFLRAFAKVIAVPDASSVDEWFVLMAAYEIRKMLGFANGGGYDVIANTGAAFGNSRQ